MSSPASHLLRPRASRLAVWNWDATLTLIKLSDGCSTVGHSTRPSPQRTIYQLFWERDFFFKKRGNQSKKLFVCTHSPPRSRICMAHFVLYLVLKANEVRWRHMACMSNKTYSGKQLSLPPTLRPAPQSGSLFLQ